MKNRKTKNNAAFTGLEAAIVLIAFVVVAAVFSYVMLGAGFFTSQKSKEVVHTGVDQATSSIQTNGEVIGTSSNGNNLDGLKVTLSLTAGNNPVDMDKLIVSYRDAGAYYPNIWDGSTADVRTWITTVQAGGVGSADNMLEQFEKVQLTVSLTGARGFAAAANCPAENEQLTLEIKPATGAILPLTLTTPPDIELVMSLL